MGCDRYLTIGNSTAHHRAKSYTIELHAHHIPAKEATMTIQELMVKGIELPAMNPVQARLWVTWKNITWKDDSTDEPERVDQIAVLEGDELLIYTSRFIDLLHRDIPMSRDTFPALQLMQVWRIWDENPEGDECDIYAEPERPMTYRPVDAPNIWRTIIDDPGINAYQGNISSDLLHLDWLIEQS